MREENKVGLNQNKGKVAMWVVETRGTKRERKRYPAWVLRELTELYATELQIT